MTPNIYNYIMVYTLTSYSYKVEQRFRIKYYRAFCKIDKGKQYLF